MSNRTMEAVLRLSSKLGNMNAFRQLSGNLDKVDRKAKAFNRTQSGLIASTSRAAIASARLLAPVAGVYGVKESLTDYAAAERRLNRIAINADKGKDAVDGMFKVVNQTSHDYAMSQDQVTSGLETLVAAGRSIEDAMSFLPSVSATAQAAGADIADIATTADAVGNSFHIVSARMQHAFDILVKSGKQGKFELKDMAQFLPSMAPAFAALGYEGEKGLAKLAAMLQTIRQRTGSAGEAATAAQNIFQKMESDETVKKFAKFGINLRAAMADARRDGKDLVDVFLDLSQKALKGDLSKIPQLFTDAQFQVGMRALLQGRQDMEGFQTALADVDGTTLRDLGQILSDNEAKLDRMASSWEKFKTSIGKAAVSAGVPDALDYVASGAERAAAVNAGLEKNGVHGFVARSIWGITHGEADKDAMAFAGGFRTDEQNRAYAAYGAYSQSRAAAAAANTIPIPTPRPDPTRMPARPTVAAPRGPLRTGMMPGPSFRETEVASMDALRRDGNSIANEIDAALSKGAETLAPALIDASRPAGQSLGDTAASAISMQADGIGTRIGTAIGTALQPYISSAIADLSRPIGSLKGGSSGRLATGNPGRSMPNAGRLPGPV